MMARYRYATIVLKRFNRCHYIPNPCPELILGPQAPELVQSVYVEGGAILLNRFSSGRLSGEIFNALERRIRRENHANEREAENAHFSQYIGGIQPNCR
jgi:hypothetical protein